MDSVAIAFLLKHILMLVRNVEPWEKDYGKGFFFKFEENSMILFSNRDIDLINKVLHKIDYKIIVVDNKLYFKDI